MSCAEIRRQRFDDAGLIDSEMRRVIERAMSWLSGYRRLSPGCERNPRHYLAFLGLAAALRCYKRLVPLTT